MLPQLHARCINSPFSLPKQKYENGVWPEEVLLKIVQG